MDDSARFTDAARDIYRKELLRHERDKRKGSISIRTPKIEDEAKRAKWYGMPPTPLATPKTWRAGGSVEF